MDLKRLNGWAKDLYARTYKFLTRPLKFSEIRVSRQQWRQARVVAFGLLLLFLLYITYAPISFESNTHIVVVEGSSLRETAELLYEKQIIRSPLVFQMLVLVMGGERSLQAGVYTFPRRLSVFEVSDALTDGHYLVPPTRVTIFEGMRVEQIAEILAHEQDIDRDEFLRIAKPYEGYLFPETYFIPEAYTEKDILGLMLDTFQEKTAELEGNVAESNLSAEEVVILASILEREARSNESMRFVAGILLKRLEIGMPLQVDATFEYVLDKSSAELTLDDLKIDSPYNTYENAGLPPTPIANPGLQSIRAVLNPIESNYLYYLTAPDGTFHYSRTFEEHKRNKALFL